MIRFVLPAEPTGKERPRLGKGWTYTPQATVNTEARIGWECRSQNPGLRVDDGTTRWSVEVDALRTSRRRLDLDNVVKVVLDALNGVVWKDDSQVKRINAREWIAGRDLPPGVFITIEPLTRDLTMLAWPDWAADATKGRA